MNDLMFNYTNILEVDNDTYSAWQTRIYEIEQSCIYTAEHLNQDFTINKDNKLLERYCKECVFTELLGDTLSVSILNYHKDRISEYEAAIRYGIN